MNHKLFVTFVGDSETEDFDVLVFAANVFDIFECFFLVVCTSISQQKDSVLHMFITIGVQSFKSWFTHICTSHVGVHLTDAINSLILVGF